MAKDTAPPETAGTERPKQPLPVVPLLNTIALLGAVGLFAYTKLVFKRPPITEVGERQRIAEEHATPTPPAVPGLVAFPSMSVNIATYPKEPSPADGTDTQIQGKFHYLTLSFSLEVRDMNQEELMERARPFIVDKLINMLGRKQFHELTHVQGRYILHSQIIDAVNQIINTLSKNPIKDGLVTNVYFTQFIVQ